MEPLHVTDELTIPGDCLSVSFVRDLGGEGTPEAARRTPTTVELRFDVSRCEALGEADKQRIYQDPRIRADRRGTVRVVFGEERSRRANLHGARELLVRLLREVLAGPPEPGEEPPPKRGGRIGLIKGRRSRGETE